MLTEKMTYTVSAVTPNTQVGDIVYVKELDSGAHAIGEVDRIYAHGVPVYGKAGVGKYL